MPDIGERIMALPTRVEGRHAWVFACGWYSEQEIEDYIRKDFREHKHNQVPRDVESKAFAIWMADQYRLAMAKGIDLAGSAMKQAAAQLATEALTARDAEVAELQAENQRLQGEMIELARLSAQQIQPLKEACAAALEVLPGLEVRSWPPGHEMKRKAIQQLQTAIGGKGDNRDT